MNSPRHGRRTMYVSLLLAATSFACRSTSLTSVANRSTTPSATVAAALKECPTANRHSDEEIRSSASDDEVPSTSQITLTGADDAVPVQKSPIESVGSNGIEREPDSSPVPANSFPVDLSVVLSLADGQNPQVGLARERIAEAYAQVDRADVLWFPSLRAGVNYNQHQGSIQDLAGNVFSTTRSAAYGGLGAGAAGAASPSVPGLLSNFHLTDAIFQPKITRHQASSRQFAATATRNDILSDSAIAYLELIRAERRLDIAKESRDKTNRIAELTRAYASTGQGSEADHDRLLVELAARDSEIAQAEEAVQTASPRLASFIHVDPCIILTTSEPFIAPLNFTSVDTTTRELVGRGLGHRPELAEHRQLVCEACERLQREKYAPLIPSLLLGLSYGGFGGGLGNSFAGGSSRFDADAVAYWELRNLGFGDQAARDEATSRLRQARMRELAVLDRIALEIVESDAQVRMRKKRIEVTMPGITLAERSYDLNLQRIENAKGLPIEALQSVQALTLARRDALNAVIDYNIAQIHLCRSTGWFEDMATPTNR